MHESLQPYLDRAEKGLIRAVDSPCGELILFNYTDQCTYERAWDEYTLQARGIIFEKATGKIVARPFGKFFNYEEQPLSNERKLEITDGRYCLQEKLDGSLGIIYWWKDKWHVATRGSFTSDQAIKATEMMSNYCFDRAVRDLTYLVEIIYPENKIIVPYGNSEKLVLLGIRRKDDGFFLPHEWLWGHGDGLHMSVAPKINLSMAAALAAKEHIPYTQEGWVAVFQDGFRLKIKGDEYLRIAKFKANLSPLAVWEALMEDKYEQLQEGCPDECLDELKAIHQRIHDDWTILTDYYVNHSLAILWESDRKTVALQIQERPEWVRSALFSRLSGKGHPAKLLLKLLRPTNNVCAAVWDVLGMSKGGK